MYYQNNQLSNQLESKLQSHKSVTVTVIDHEDMKPVSLELLRFEEKREHYIWAHPDEICFVKSADHYVQSLIKCGKQLKWMTRHSTLKELLELLPSDKFIRLNKFYLLNLHFFSHINDCEKLLYFKDATSIPIPHRISPFLRHMLNTGNT